MASDATGPRKTRRALRMYPLRLLLDILPELLVERRSLSRPRRVVASLPLAHRFARRSDGRTARQCRGSFPPLSLPHDHELRQSLPQGPEPGESDRRNQEHDDRAANLTPRGAPFWGLNRRSHAANAGFTSTSYSVGRRRSAANVFDVFRASGAAANRLRPDDRPRGQHSWRPGSLRSSDRDARKPLSSAPRPQPLLRPDADQICYSAWNGVSRRPAWSPRPRSQPDLRRPLSRQCLSAR